MKNFSLSIYGNVIHDHILFVDKFPDEGFAKTVKEVKHRTGAISNIARAYFNLTKSKPKIISSLGNNIDLNKRIQKEVSRFSKYIFDYSLKNTSTATIIINKENSTRTGLVSWGACLDITNFTETGSDWKHFSYIDKLLNLDEKILKSLTGIKSVDLTSFDYDEPERRRIYKCLEEIDYIVSSVEESCFLSDQSSPKQASKKLGAMCKKYAIIHDTEGSHISDGNKYSYITSGHEMLQNVSVLGAGDIFVASFIASFCAKKSIEDITKMAHIRTYNILRENNDKKI